MALTGQYSDGEVPVLVVVHPDGTVEEFDGTVEELPSQAWKMHAGPIADEDRTEPDEDER